MFRGVRTWLDKINGLLLPLYVLGLIAAVVWTIVEYGGDSGWLTFEPAAPRTSVCPAGGSRSPSTWACGSS